VPRTNGLIPGRDVPVVILQTLAVGEKFAATDVSANTVFGHHAGKTGWTAGGGVEAHLGGNWTGKIEYLYLDFGTVTSTTANLLNSTPLAVSLRSRVVDQVARVGVNYKFDFDYATLVNLPR
jgi:opacity protein-like surface antigen